MKLFPYDDFVIETSLSVNEVKQRIKENIEPLKLYRFRVDKKDNEKDYEGNITEKGFYILKILYFRNWFRPDIFGEVTECDGKTRIYISMQMMLIMYVILFLWVAVFTFFSIKIFYNQYQDGYFEPPSLLIPALVIGAYAYITISYKIVSIPAKKFLQQLFT